MTPALPEGNAVRGAGPGPGPGGCRTGAGSVRSLWNAFLRDDFRNGLRVVSGPRADRAVRAVPDPRLRNGEHSRGTIQNFTSAHLEQVMADLRIRTYFPLPGSAGRPSPAPGAQR